MFCPNCAFELIKKPDLAQGVWHCPRCSNNFYILQTTSIEYYKIIGFYTGEVIGLTSDINSVTMDASRSTFEPITKEEYDKLMEELE